tara:strand:- start:329 stop:1126 length:798 start_codon:yes stop_codon:yes gene_type:complete
MVVYSLLIIVPTLNSYKLLSKLVNSLISQNFKKWRVIFVDGKSSLEHINYLNKLNLNDSRFSWVSQEDNYEGIYGAMNQGINYVKENEWVVFWGSDDWAFDENSLQNIISQIDRFEGANPDFIVAKGRYVDLSSYKLKRKSVFVDLHNKVLSSSKFRFLMFLGNTPPHQTTIFSPTIIKKKIKYRTKFKIAADLDYFLNISRSRDIRIYLMNLEIVKIGMGGFSSLSNNTRFKEVYKCYKYRFGIFAYVPFLLRYIKRIVSVLQS